MAKIRNRYNQAPHLTQDTKGKMTTPQLNILESIIYVQGRQENTNPRAQHSSGKRS